MSRSEDLGASGSKGDTSVTDARETGISGLSRWPAVCDLQGSLVQVHCETSPHGGLTRNLARETKRIWPVSHPQ